MSFNPTKLNLGSDPITNATATDRDPWQEPFKRFSSVSESSIIRASELLSGMTGSWAAQYTFGPSANDVNTQPEFTTPTNSQIKVNNLGHPGMSEIDFIPYCHGTNRFGNKGGALIGSPISFSIVGPTPKVGGEKLIWQWVLDASNNNIVFDDVIMDTDFPNWIIGLIGPGVATVDTLYNIDASDLSSRFDGGLYLMVVETGHPAELLNSGTAATGGVGDGAIIHTTGDSRVPIQPKTLSSKTEIFRITEFVDDGSGNFIGFHLDETKMLSDYFDISSNPADTNIIRHIMLFEPAATRLVAIPDSGAGKGREQVFAFVPPERALTSEHQMTYTDWTSTSVSSTSEYPWPPTDFQIDARDSFYYNNMSALPINKPEFEDLHNAYLVDQGDFNAINYFGAFLIHWGADEVPTVGQVVRIHSINTKSESLDETEISWGSVLGDYEIISVDADLIAGAGYILTLNRYPEVNPETGVSFWGLSQFFMAAAGSESPILRCSIHNPIRTLWESYYFDADKLESSRLTNLIDPRWVGREGLNLDYDLSVGKSPYRPDKAIFDTTTSNDGAEGSNANPGNLADLGFRVVLFPAKLKVVPTVSGTEAVLAPDFSRPISSNDLIIDPDVSEHQYFEVDYANGFVRLSHPPQAKYVGEDGAGDLAPSDDIFSASNNPRQEMVIFAACVPYTQEPGQLGAGPRVTCKTQLDTSCSDMRNASGSGVFSDVYGNLISLKLTSAPQTVVCNSNVGQEQQIILEGRVSNLIPPSGFFELFQNDTPVFTNVDVRGSLFEYYGVTIESGNTVLHGVHGGRFATTDTVTFDSENQGHIEIRRELLTPQNLYGVAGIPYANDVSYGSAKRAGDLRFSGVTSTVNLDGSVTLEIEDTSANVVANMDDMFSSWLLEDGEVTASVDGSYNMIYAWSEATIIYRGQRLVIPAGEGSIGTTLADGSTETYYIYTDGSTCWVGACEPLPYTLNSEYVLLGQVVYTRNGSTATATVTDLRYPLLDINRRLDIFVGHRPGTMGPHFNNLADAVAYANILQEPGSGNSDFRIRIRVVSFTEESSSQLPIMIQTDGLTIESDPIIDTTRSITWYALDKPLIDLNGHSDLVFDGLSFECTATNVDNVEPLQVLFTNTGGASHRVTINNCRLTGSQGFIAMVNGSLQDSRITNNYGKDLKDFGIYCTNQVTDPITTNDTGDTSTFTITSGYLKISKGVESLIVTSAHTCTVIGDGSKVTISNGTDSIDLVDGGQNAQIESFGEGSVTDGTDTLDINETDGGVIYWDNKNNQIKIYVINRVLEKSIIEYNRFSQAADIGNMADNERVLGTATATITTTAGFSLTISDDDGTIAVDIPAGETWTIENDGTNAILYDASSVASINIDAQDMTFYPKSTSTGGTATISIPGKEDIVVTLDTWGYMTYLSGVLHFNHGPNQGPVAGGFTFYTNFISDSAMSITDQYALLSSSILSTMHNKINYNILEGFHNGIFANVLWESDISNNYIKDTKNSGIYLGVYAGYYTVDNNVLENIFTATPVANRVLQWPDQQSIAPVAGNTDFGTPIKYGLFASGMHGALTSNAVSTASTLNISMIGDGATATWTYDVFDIYLFGMWQKASLNTVTWCIGGSGYALDVISNTVSQYGSGGLSANASILIYAWSSLIKNNKCQGDIYIDGSLHTVISDNTAVKIETSNPNDSTSTGTSDRSLISGNQISEATVDADSSGVRVIGNTFVPAATVLECLNIDGDDCIVSDNLLGRYVTQSEMAAISLISVTKMINVTGNHTVIQGNNITLQYDLDTKDHDITLSGDKIGIVIDSTGRNSVVQGNDINIDIDAKTVGDHQSIITISDEVQGIYVNGTGSNNIPLPFVGTENSGHVISNNNIRLNVSMNISASTETTSSIVRDGATQGILIDTAADHSSVTGNVVNTNLLIHANNGITGVNSPWPLLDTSGVTVKSDHSVISNNTAKVNFILTNAGSETNIIRGNIFPIDNQADDCSMMGNYANLNYSISGSGTLVRTQLSADMFTSGGQISGNTINDDLKLEDGADVVVIGNTMNQISTRSEASPSGKTIIFNNRIKTSTALGWFGGSIAAWADPAKEGNNIT